MDKSNTKIVLNESAVVSAVAGVESGSRSNNAATSMESKPLPTPLERAHSRMAKNVWFNFAGYAITMGASFLISPLMVHKLGNTAYGVWALVQQFVGYSLLLDFGIRIAVTRFLAQHHARSDQKEIDRLLSTASVFALLPAGFIVLGGIVVAYFFPYWFSIPPQLLQSARLALFTVSVAMAISGPGSLFTACVTAASRYDLLTIRNSVFAILRALLLWGFLSMGYGLLAVALINLFATLVGLAMDVWFARSELPQLRIRFSAFDWTILRTLLQFSFFAFLISIAVRLVYWSDNVVVGAALGPAAVTFYAVGGTMVQYAREGMDNLTRIYAPLSAQMEALGMKEALRKLYVTGARLGSLMIVPVAIGFLMTGPAFLTLWMGPEFGAKSGPVMIILTGTLFLLPLAAIYSHILYATNRHKVNGFIAIVEAVTNLGLSIWLVRRMGIIGVAWGTLIPAIVTQGVLMPIYTARVLDLSPFRVYGQALLFPILAALPSVIWLWISSTLHWHSTWSLFFLSNLVGVLLYVVTVWLTILRRNEKDFVIGTLRKAGLKLDRAADPAS